MARYKLETYQQGFLSSQYKTTYHKQPPDNVFDLIYRSNIEAVTSAIKNGTNVNLRNDKGQTLFHYALLYNQIAIAEILISKGADLNTEDNNGQKVKDLIQEKYPDIYEKLYNNSSSLSTMRVWEHDLAEDNQIQESGKTDDFWCVIL